MNDTVSWLIGCPVTDENFKSKLNNATKGQIEEALKIISEKKCAKNKIVALKRALKKAR